LSEQPKGRNPALRCKTSPINITHHDIEYCCQRIGYKKYSYVPNVAAESGGIYRAALSTK
jgi:hypothetical protein